MKKPRGRITKRLEALDKAHVWHPFTQMSEWEGEKQLIIERGEGNYLIDTDGNRYLDGVSSLWVTVHGHGKAEIDRAVKEQLGKIAHSTLLGLGNAPSIELAKRLVDITPASLKRVFFSDNGSTAVEVALKMAFQYHDLKEKGTRKKRFLSFSGAYHGDTFGSMTVGESSAFTKRFRPLLKKQLHAPYPYCYRCPIKKEYPSCNIACLGELEKVLKRDKNEIAACIIEPLAEGASGIITSPPGFLREVRRLTRRYGVLLIADEVATGFGRTGRLFAIEHEGVVPDFLCLAKGLTGGYLPLAATLTTERIYKVFLGRYDEYRAFFHGHTYTGNPLGAAAAIANLDIFAKEGVIERLKPKARLFKHLLEGLYDLKHVGDIRVRGLMAGVELVKERAKKSPFPAQERRGHRIAMAARERGLIIRPLGDVIVLMPPLSIKDSEIRSMAKILRDCIEEIAS